MDSIPRIHVPKDEENPMNQLVWLPTLITNQDYNPKGDPILGLEKAGLDVFFFFHNPENFSWPMTTG